MNEINKQPEPVSYIVYESAMARAERHIKRLVVALIISILLMFASNAIWLYAWNLYDYESVIVDSADGIANYIGTSGSIFNGTNHGEETAEAQSRPEE